MNGSGGAAAMALTLVMAFEPAAMADDRLDLLYRVTVRVTGDREETRIPAIPLGFVLAAQKITGNPDVAANPGFAEFAAKSTGMVWSYTYHDRMFGRPIHDEQGTRDRPFDLTLQFDSHMMNDALKAMGEKPWPVPRPQLGVVVAVKDMVRSYLLAEGAERGSDQRAAFGDASERFAIPVIFPAESDLVAAGVTLENMDTASPDALRILKEKAHVDALLFGQLEWNKAEQGWTGTWHLPENPQSEVWSIHGVNFDAAFRNAVGGAAKRLRP